MRVFEIKGWDTGTKIRLLGWDDDRYVYANEGIWKRGDGLVLTGIYSLLLHDADWELYVPKPKSKTMYIHEYWSDLGSFYEYHKVKTKLCWIDFVEGFDFELISTTKIKIED